MDQLYPGDDLYSSAKFLNEQKMFKLVQGSIAWLLKSKVSSKINTLQKFYFLWIENNIPMRCF